MELAKILHQYHRPFMRKYGDRLSSDQLKAFNAILECRTNASGQVAVSCPHCAHIEWKPLSCGNRNCPKCQNHNTSKWINRQVNKLLPVLYFMVTFTLPFQFRTLAKRRPKEIYSLFFLCVADVLNDFGLNPKHLGAQIGMTMVLHTNSRKLNYHPYIHVIVPERALMPVSFRKSYFLYQQFRQLRKKPYWGNHFWAKGYCVDTVGLDAEMIS